MSPAPASKPARPARSPAPPLPAFETLEKAHREVLQVLKDLQNLLDHVDEKGPDAAARESAKRILQFFHGTARKHHADEERLVFPGLLSSGDAELVPHVQRLQQDHGWLEEDWIELSLQIQAIADGFEWYDLAMLRQALPVFINLYQEHIALEEAVVYPAARRREQALRDGAQQRSG